MERCHPATIRLPIPIRLPRAKPQGLSLARALLCCRSCEITNASTRVYARITTIKTQKIMPLRVLLHLTLLCAISQPARLCLRNISRRISIFMASKRYFTSSSAKRRLPSSAHPQAVCRNSGAAQDFSSAPVEHACLRTPVAAIIDRGHRWREEGADTGRRGTRVSG